ncbi:hypothetical protein KGD82_22805 [Nocardiopsis eucommiae]|uniref:Uncharacterized protein n=1 Tax=Nocardiopsis eucommiae TaxID=2831970 RepID=A0A975L864_9ACTN|nr:hypothetical protein KGD82_22805 [Nocardiopsis eucommiae]
MRFSSIAHGVAWGRPSRRCLVGRSSEVSGRAAPRARAGRAGGACWARSRVGSGVRSRRSARSLATWMPWVRPRRRRAAGDSSSTGAAIISSARRREASGRGVTASVSSALLMAPVSLSE